MGTKANPTMIGAFIVGAVALIIAAVLVFGKGQLFTETNTFVLYFEGSVNGLNKGAPVKFRGVDVGAVLEVQALYNPHDYTGQIQVVLEVEPGRFNEVTDGVVAPAVSRDPDKIKALVERGLRGQLQMESFVTGLLYVDLHFHPDAAPEQPSGIQSDYPELPTIPTEMEEVAETVRQGIQQLRELPFKQLFNKALVMFESLNSILNADETKQALDALGSMLQEADQGVAELGQQVPQLLDRFGGTATAATAALEAVQTVLSDVQQLVRDVDGHVNPLLGNTQKTVTTARGALRQAQKTLKTLESKAAPALGEVEKAFAAAAGLAGSDSVVVTNLAHSLEALEEAARSIRILVDYLQRNPESLLRGKGRAGGQ